MSKITGFLKEVWAELKNVTWLSRKDMYRSTIGVGFVVLIFSIYISLVDLGLTNIIKAIIE